MQKSLGEEISAVLSMVMIDIYVKREEPFCVAVYDSLRCYYL